MLWHESIKNSLVQELIIILSIYLNTIINFEGIYTILFPNISLAHQYYTLNFTQYIAHINMYTSWKYRLVNTLFIAKTLSYIIKLDIAYIYMELFENIFFLLKYHYFMGIIFLLIFSFLFLFFFHNQHFHTFWIVNMYVWKSFNIRHQQIMDWLEK